MANLGSPSRTAEILRKYNFNFQKKYGQNFLIDANVLERIVQGAGVTKEDVVLEIGPGIGTMTQYLAEAAGKVIAIEIDDKLIPILEETLSPYDNVRIIHQDVLKVDVNALAEEENDGRPFKVVANLPYYITTPIIMGLFEKKVPVESMTVMVQKEVARRMQAGPGTKDYGVLSLAVQYYAEPEIMLEVSPGCFMPRPGVGSAVIHLKRQEQPPVQAEEGRMFHIIRAAFNQRRKTLVNSLKNAAGLSYSREEVEEALEQMGLPAAVRGEALTLCQFAKLSSLLGK